MSGPRILSIPPGADFLPTLIEALLEGRLVEDFAPGTDPLALAATTIWVPTRRAVRTLQDAFCERLGREGAILPDIRALGDGDGEELALAEAGLADGERVDLHEDRPEASATARHLVLTRLVHAWTRTLNESERARYAGAPILVPSSLSDAVGFAGELAELMDAVATEGASWEGLAELMPREGELAAWWQLTLRFLSIATRAWPDHLARTGLADPATMRVERLMRQAAAYGRQAEGERVPGFLSPFADRPGPVIAAGSTGSIPATAALLSAIARMPQGAVVLPGLDRDMGAEEWDLLCGVAEPSGEADRATLPAHPQYGLARLLTGMGAGRETVEHLDPRDEGQTSPSRVRERLLSRAMRPSGAATAWAVEPAREERPLADAHVAHALETVAVLDAPDERSQALAVAFALREGLTLREGARSALVTPDRVLARRVAVELRRFGIEADDSAGTPLPNRPAGRFARLVARMAHDGAGGLGRAPRACDPLVLVSLIKDPMARFGLDRGTAERGGRALELAVVNGAIRPLRPGALAEGLDRARAGVEEDAHAHSTVTRLVPEDWTAGRRLAERLDTLFAPPAGRDGDALVPLPQLVRETVALLEACAADAEGASALYEGEDGRELAAFLSDLLAQDDDLQVESGEWPAVLERLMAPRAVRLAGGSHPRVVILGPIEARLQRFDRVVLGGLQEGVWPQGTASGAFLSRPMRESLGLPAPERRVGLAAHDVVSLACGPDVVLSQTLRSEGGPTVPSRFLQRLTMQAGEAASRAMRVRGARYLDWAAAVDAHGTVRPAARPTPRPPVAVRPRKVSVTEVDGWVCDPYALYARRILALDPMDVPEASRGEVDVRVRGTVLHEVVEAWCRADDGRQDSVEATEAMVALAEASFARHGIPSHAAGPWRERVRRLGPDIHAWHREATGIGATVLLEAGASLRLSDHLRLTARADRIEVLRDGTARLYDLKSGTVPSGTDVAEGRAAQLPLTAHLIAQGAFRHAAASPVEEARYLVMGDRKGWAPATAFSAQGKEGKKPTKGLDDLSREYVARLAVLAQSFRDPARAYHAQWRPSVSGFPSAYDHLARTAEWSAAPAGTEGS